MCSKCAHHSACQLYNATHLLNFGQPCKMCAQKATAANCVKYAGRAKCTKMCPILAEAATVDTTAPEEAFEFKAGY